MGVKLNIDAQFLLKEQDHPSGITFEATGKTVGDCLKLYLATKPHLYVFINKQAVTSEHLEKEVQDGDEIKIMYARVHGCCY
jgi:sulfur carrier protein ThiS